MNKLKEFVKETRYRGNTTWLLKAALKLPTCVFVCVDDQQKKSIQFMYNKLKKERNIFIKFFDWIRLIDREIWICTLDELNTFNSYHKKEDYPVIFDNYCILHEIKNE